MKAAVILFILACSMQAAVIFSDDFTSDQGNWTTLFGSQDTILGGKLIMTNTDTNGLEWTVALSVSAADFSMSALTEMSNADTNGRAGLSFRVQGNADCYQFFVYPDGLYMVSKMVNNSVSNFFGNRLQANSFISPSVNLLKVVVQGDTLSFLCNGQLLCRFTDTTISSGGAVGLIAGGLVTVAFDDVSVDDLPVWDLGLSRFADNFNDGNLFGWRQYSLVGSFAINASKLRMTTHASDQFTMLVSDGCYGSNDTVSVVSSKVSGTGNYFFGVMYHYATVSTGPASVAVQSYAFCIVNGSYYTVIKVDTSGTSMLFQPLAYIGIQPTTNTLKVINSYAGLDAQFKPIYAMALYINNSLVKTCTDTGATRFASGGVGFLGNGGCVVDFDDFNISGVAQLPKVEVAGLRAGLAGPSISAFPNPFNTGIKISLQNPLGTDMTLTLHDVSGRLVRTGTLSGAGGRAELTWDASNLPAGVYYARLLTGNKTVSTKLILVR